MLHQGQPALTVDNVRAVYSQHPTIAPLPIRRRIVFVGAETYRHRAMVQQLSETCEVSYVVPGDNDDEILCQLCDTADLVIATTESFQRFDFLHCWHRPVLVDSPPLTPSVPDEAAHDTALHEQNETVAETQQLWIQIVDGVVCTTEAERAYWLDQFELATQAHLDLYPWQVVSNRDNLVMVVPTPRDTQADEDLAWSQAIVPLAQFCQQPRYALDRQVNVLLFREPALPPLPTPLWALPAKVWQVLRQSGWRKTTYEMRQYIRWKIGI
jgi:hypothetical protein